MRSNRRKNKKFHGLFFAKERLPSAEAIIARSPALARQIREEHSAKILDVCKENSL